MNTLDTPTRSFSKALNGDRTIDNPKLPIQVIKGDFLCIKIIHDAYEKGLVDCKRILHGRSVQNKGDKSYSVKDLMLKLSKLWNTTFQWKMISLKCRFMILSFQTKKIYVLYELGTL